MEYLSLFCTGLITLGQLPFALSQTVTSQEVGNATVELMKDPDALKFIAPELLEPARTATVEGRKTSEVDPERPDLELEKQVQDINNRIARDLLERTAGTEAYLVALIISHQYLTEEPVLLLPAQADAIRDYPDTWEVSWMLNRFCSDLMTWGAPRYPQWTDSAISFCEQVIDHAHIKAPESWLESPTLASFTAFMKARYPRNNYEAPYFPFSLRHDFERSLTQSLIELVRLQHLSPTHSLSLLDKAERLLTGLKAQPNKVWRNASFLDSFGETIKELQKELDEHPERWPEAFPPQEKHDFFVLYPALRVHERELRAVKFALEEGRQPSIPWREGEDISDLVREAQAELGAGRAEESARAAQKGAAERAQELRDAAPALPPTNEPQPAD